MCRNHFARASKRFVFSLGGFSLTRLLFPYTKSIACVTLGGPWCVTVYRLCAETIVFATLCYSECPIWCKTRQCPNGLNMLRDVSIRRYWTLLPLVIVKDQSSLLVYLNMHKTTNLWQFELNRSSKLRDEVVCFQMLISRPQILNKRSRNQIRGKLLHSRKLRHFRGSCFSQCFNTINLSLLLVTK